MPTDAQEQQIVRWIRKGTYFEAGQAYRRVPGDEDIVPAFRATKMLQLGWVEIVRGADSWQS